MHINLFKNKMKKNFVIFFCILFSSSSFGQIIPASKDTTKKLFIGFNCGLFLDKFHAGSIKPKPFDTITYEKNYSPSFNFGLSISPQIKYFALRVGLNYYYTNHIIKYNSYDYYPGLWESSYADYKISTSILRISFLPTISFNTKIISYIFIGPDLVRPIHTKIKGQINFQGANMNQPNGYSGTTNDDSINETLSKSTDLQLGIGFRKKIKNDFINIEFVYGIGLKDCFISPSMRENFFILNIGYAFKL